MPLGTLAVLPAQYLNSNLNLNVYMYVQQAIKQGIAWNLAS